MAGHAQRLMPSSPKNSFMPPHPLSIDEIRRLRDQCDERFVKLHVRRILHDEVTSVEGVMLVTPDCVMFDADESSPLVVKNGAAMYSMIVPMMSVTSVSVYHENPAICRDDHLKMSDKSAADLLFESNVTRQPTLHSSGMVGLDAAIASASHSDHLSLSSFVTKLNVDKQTSPVSCVKTVVDTEGNCLSTSNVDKTVHQSLTHLSPTNEASVEVPYTEIPVAELGSPGHAIDVMLQEHDEHSDNVRTLHIAEENRTVVTNRSVDEQLSLPLFEAQPHLVNRRIKMDCCVPLSSKTDGQSPSSSSIVRQSACCSPSASVLPVYSQDATDLFLNINVRQSENTELSSDVSKSDSYWYLVPSDKVDPLYAFFILWSYPYEEQSEELVDQGGFVFVNKPDGLSSPSDNLHYAVRHNNSFTKDWEIVNTQELRRLISEAEIDNLPLPDLSQPSSILDESLLRVLMSHLPARAEGSVWTLVYSSSLHGFSLRTLYRQTSGIDSPVLLVIKDATGQIFGTMQSSPIKKSDLFYGTGESYLFSFCGGFKKFSWTGINNFFTKGDNESLCFGASKGNYGLWLDGDLYHGRTQHCLTYNNDLLTVAEDFTIKYVEVWCFV
jgi:hypothetical protein